MRLIRLLGPSLGGTTLLIALLLVVSGCGASSTSSAASSSPSSSATPCPSPRANTQFRATIGSVSSISGSTMKVATLSGGSTTVNLSSSTRFLKETSLQLSALKEGTAVTVAIIRNSDNTYSASRITVVNRSAAGASGFGTTRSRTGVNARCFNRSQFNNGAAAGTTTTRGISGTTGQVSGDNLAVTDAQGTDYTVSVTSKTQILQTVSASAADLKTGTAVSVSGAPASSGTITARIVTILPKLLTSSTHS